MPQISVIVPVYKVEPYLRRCVDSILGQTFTDFELILVDDGSPDNCGAICDEYAKKDTRIIVIHQENAGLSAARNAGIDYAFANSNSEWLTFIDSDDWVHVKYLSFLYHAAQKNNTDLSICEVLKTDNDVLSVQINGNCILMDSLYTYVNHYNITIVAWAKLYKKHLFTNTRFPLSKLHEDAFVIYKIIFEAQKVAVCWDQLYYYFQNQNSIMNSKWSPKRLDEIEAHESQLVYLNAKKYLEALATEEKIFMRVLARHIVALEKLPEYKIYKHNLQKKLRNVLKKYIFSDSYPIKNNEWVYESAYPRFMKIYWILQAALKKLKIK